MGVGELYMGGLYSGGKTLLLSSIKQVFRHFSLRARCEMCSKLTIKIPEYVKLTIKLKIRTQFTSFWPHCC